MARVEKITIRADLLTEAIDTLDHVGCLFWACEGPTLRPKPMVTCVRCATLARLRKAAGRNPRTGE